MSWDELREHADRGLRIGSHTVSHPHLTRVSDAELGRELDDSKGEIEAELGRPCRELAYPYGEQDERVRAAARRAGYERAYALRGRKGDPYALPRVDLYRRHTVPRALIRALMT
jgi:peptidoglycan/xylan/chitin deacetylase (PgdA/CDA1 family)